MCWCLKLIAALCVISAVCLNSASGIRSRRTSIIDDQAVKSVRVNMEDTEVLRLFNITNVDAIKKINEMRSTLKAGSTAVPKDNRFISIKEHRVGDIRNRIELALSGHGTTSTTSSETPNHPEHDMAAYPICNSETNESSWHDDRNVTMRFGDSLFGPKSDKLYLEGAFLRLYKLNPNHTVEPTEAPKECGEPNIDSQIRVTVSIVLRRNRREKKKRICNSVMMNVSHSGWVEIDIKRAIHIWESVERQRPSSVLVGWLMLEVHDEEERPLKPGLFFRPPKCDQADHAIPWNFYRSQSTLSSPFTEQVPRFPRIDITLTGYANFLPHNQHARPNSNLNRELYRITHHNSEESTTLNTPTDNLLESSASTEIHRHRQRHARHHHHHAHNSAPATADTGAVAVEDQAATSSTRADASIEENTGQMLDC